MREKDDFYSPLPGLLKGGFIISVLLFLAFAIGYYFLGNDLLLILTITFGTITYHFVIRFVSPVILEALFHKHYDASSWWFRQKKWEPRLYKDLKVKKWKRKVLAYEPSEFSVKVHTLDEIVNNMCHAEAVHELIVLLSLASIFFSIPFGEVVVFAVTAVMSACADMVFVIIQRYNRPRLQRITSI